MNPFAMFPNAKSVIENNKVVTTIPFEDIARVILSNCNENIRDSVEINKYPDGIEIKLNIINSVFKNLADTNIIIEPKEIRIFIPKEEIVSRFKMPNSNIKFEDGNIVIEMDVNIAFNVKR